MKVLLLHEFSGVHSELRKALRAKGVDADIATFGDYHKKFSSDIFLGPVDPTPLGTLQRAIRQLSLVNEFKQYDIIQSISPAPFNKLVSRIMENMLLKSGKPPIYIYLSAGADTFYRKYSNRLDYAPPEESVHFTAPDSLEERIAARADGLVSCLWDYRETLRLAGRASTFIPLPVNVADLEALEIGNRDRLTVYHPLNRQEGNDFKGTSNIREAFAILRPEFDGLVDFVERGGMSIDEYHAFSRTVDVIVDQTNSYTYGMSGLYGLARGQVVLSGNEPATHELMVYRDSPVVNITPDISQIVGALRNTLSDRVALRELGARGRRHALHYHEAAIVADQYLSLYDRLLSSRSR